MRKILLSLMYCMVVHIFSSDFDESTPPMPALIPLISLQSSLCHENKVCSFLFSSQPHTINLQLPVMFYEKSDTFDFTTSICSPEEFSNYACVSQIKHPITHQLINDNSIINYREFLKVFSALPYGVQMDCIDELRPHNSEKMSENNSFLPILIAELLKNIDDLKKQEPTVFNRLFRCILKMSRKVNCFVRDEFHNFIHAVIKTKFLEDLTRVTYADFLYHHQHNQKEALQIYKQICQASHEPYAKIRSYIALGNHYHEEALTYFKKAEALSLSINSDPDVRQQIEKGILLAKSRAAKEERKKQLSRHSSPHTQQQSHATQRKTNLENALEEEEKDKKYIQDLFEKAERAFKFYDKKANLLEAINLAKKRGFLSLQAKAYIQCAHYTLNLSDKRDFFCKAIELLTAVKTKSASALLESANNGLNYLMENQAHCIQTLTNAYLKDQKVKPGLKQRVVQSLKFLGFDSLSLENLYAIRHFYPDLLDMRTWDTQENTAEIYE